MIEFGIITGVDYENASVDVTIEGLEDRVLKEIPIVFNISSEFKLIDIMRKKVTAVIYMKDDGRAVCGGYIHSKSNPSEIKENKIIMNLADGTHIEYDLEKSKLTASLKGEVDISTSSTIKLKAEKIIIDGELETTKSIKAGIDITAMGISLLKHIHGTSNGPTTAPTGGV